MSCSVCHRNACTASFHSIEEQDAAEAAEKAGLRKAAKLLKARLSSAQRHRCGAMDSCDGCGAEKALEEAIEELEALS